MNIFVSQTSANNDCQNPQYVIGDFDSAHLTGSTICLKKGTKDWSRHKDSGISTAVEDDDWYAFHRLKVWLVGKMCGQLEDYANIGSRVVDVPKL